MVANGINRGELVSLDREFLSGLNKEEVKRLSRGDFAKSTGVDPLSILSEYKQKLARILHNEFKLPYKKICELLEVST